VHTDNAYYLLLRRIVTRNACATGEIFRAALGRPHFWYVAGEDNNTLLCFLVAAWWMAIALAPFVLSGAPAAAAVAGLILLPLVTMSLRWRSVSLGVYSVAAWNVYALCFLPGLFRGRKSPADWIESTILQRGVPTVRPSPREARRTVTSVGSPACARSH
jgi:hypothetical protein